MKKSLFCLPLIILGLYACKQQNKVVPVAATPDYAKAQSFLNLNEDSAFFYFNKVAGSSKDSLTIAMAYSNMAILQYEKGDYYGSQESLLTSLKYLNEQKESDYYCLLSDYNQLGRSSSNLKNYTAAIGYYDQALKYSKDDAFKVIALNNKAVTYQHMGQYAQAIAIYESILDQSRANKKEYARILSNLNKVKWLQDPAYPAAPNLLLALQIRTEIKDDWGLNASYSHLSDFYSLRRPDSALFYAGKMYTIAQQLNSPDDELEALQKLITLGAPKTVKGYFTRYQVLNDSLQTARNGAKNQFALIRYEAEKNKADVLRLQKDNADKKIQILKQRTILYGTISGFIIICSFVIVWYRWKAKNTIRGHQLRTSQKVHDVVANGLYSIIAEVEHRDVEKGSLLDRLEVLYEQSRDISYEQPMEHADDFHDVVLKLLDSFSSPGTKIGIVGNSRGLWTGVKDPVQFELKQILKELMVNMKKHSSARNVVVKFVRDGDCIKIHYVDDGVGLPSNFSYGNGLANTENRIESIGGGIIFEKNGAKGLKLQLHFPIA